MNPTKPKDDELDTDIRQLLEVFDGNPTDVNFVVKQIAAWHRTAIVNALEGLREQKYKYKIVHTGSLANPTYRNIEAVPLSAIDNEIKRYRGES